MFGSSFNHNCNQVLEDRYIAPLKFSIVSHMSVMPSLDPIVGTLWGSFTTDLSVEPISFIYDEEQSTIP